MKRKLKRIEPISLAKISGLSYAAMGLLAIPFFLVMPIIASFLPDAERADIPASGFAAIGIGMAIFLPLMYGVMGFVMGLIGALVYNLFSKWIGGIEVEVE